ncbi:hypothetical protein [Marinibactrum halimedae]|uniref:Uncharacterized protein n=1 Tax=Marinibactrum halimedae TaxID=1444977 RepID=A0AA37WKS0_9GAMM|nr:hypothetical protein [Marinibactrum halimedae]MCD9457752.1 hypothetical protein [Marinibactrum halimedae]GLS24874.1 hypothetical protein GCM10007877_05880 [Marinibactrum halimedae]
MKITLLSIIFSAITLLTACGGETNNPFDQDNTDSDAPVDFEVQLTSITIVDDNGEPVEVDTSMINNSLTLQ